MFKKMNVGAWGVFMALAIAGCATGSNRNYDAQIGSLNSRVASLEAQLSEKNQEISKLQGELENANSQLNAAKAVEKVASEESDLK